MNVYKVRQEVINGNHDIHGELIVLAKNIPDAIEVANQYLAKGHDPITSVTLICEDVKLMKSDDTRKRVLAEAMAGLCERKPLTWADLSEEDKKSLRQDLNDGAFPTSFCKPGEHSISLDKHLKPTRS